MSGTVWSFPLCFAIAAGAWAADAQHGAAILANESCLACHSVHGAGEGHEASGIAPDLGASLTPTYTVPALASVLWNHSPTMWAEISAQGMARSLSSESDWEDVFVYLYSLRFFEMPAETRRGKEAFESMGCGACHAAGETGAGPGKPVRDWARVDDPVTLVYQMWNHASTMKEQFAARNQEWKRLNGRDFLDLTAYVQLIQRLPPNREVSLPDAARGREAFDENCRACHTGPLSLATRLRNKTWMDIGAGLWNHGALPQSLPALSAAEIREVIAYVWELQYLGPEGNVPRGQSDFENKGCVSCHRNPANGEPESPHRGKTFTALSMVALGWGPARDMHQQMQNKGTPWPHLSPDEVSDLVAYMNTFGR